MQGITAMDAWMFAPHRRGSTLATPDLLRSAPVCPAQAGVYPWRALDTFPSRGLPRTGGGLPATKWALSLRRVVCPAQAGVYPPDPQRRT